MGQRRGSRRGGRDRNVDWVTNEFVYNDSNVGVIVLEEGVLFALPLLIPQVVNDPTELTQPQSERVALTVRGHLLLQDTIVVPVNPIRRFHARITIAQYDPASGGVLLPQSNYTLLDALSADDHFLWEFKDITPANFFLTGQPAVRMVPVEVNVRRRIEPISTLVLLLQASSVLGPTSEADLVNVYPYLRTLVQTVVD